MCLSTTTSSSTLLGIQSRFENIHLNYQSKKNLNGKYKYFCLLNLIIIIIIITFISIAQIQQFSFQMCFTILEEIKSTLPKSLFLQSLFTNQIRCWLLVFDF